MNPKRFEKEARDAFNESQGSNARKSRVPVGNQRHEFDLYEPNVGVGGISTSPWLNRTGTNNTGGQDRVTAELLWLNLCRSAEKKVLILKDKSMADNIYKRFGRSGFFDPVVEIWLYNPIDKAIEHYKDL
jgi:hypothetical protein